MNKWGSIFYKIAEQSQAKLSEQECIPVEWVPTVAVAGTRCQYLGGSV